MSATITFLIVNIVGGSAVLGGYLICLYLLLPDQRETLWGSVQGLWKPVFVVSMLIAAAGYLAFSYVILFKSNPMEFSSRFLDTKHAVSIICMIVLISAATWMPATITYLKTSNSIWWIISVTSLWITVISLFAATTVVMAFPLAIPSAFYRMLAISGISYITFHCLVFDAIIWVSKFHIPLRN